MRVSVLCLCLLGLLGCDDVPSLVFDGAAAGDAPSAPLDGPSSTSDAADAGEPPEGGCPGEVPDGASLCCGRIACFGASCPIACPGCVQACVPGEVCCPNPLGKAFCRAGTSC